MLYSLMQNGVLNHEQWRRKKRMNLLRLPFRKWEKEKQLVVVKGPWYIPYSVVTE